MQKNNCLTKDKLFYFYDAETQQGDYRFHKEDVILALEETIKKIENTDLPNYNTFIEIKAYVAGLNKSLQIIKEQFPIIEKVKKMGRYTKYQDIYAGLCSCPSDRCTCPLCNNKKTKGYICPCQKESK